MIKILLPDNNISEREYIINILINEFLGLEYLLLVDKKINDWTIVLENGNKLIIEDHFFSKFPKDFEYLNEKNIPQKIEFGKNNFIVEKDIPIIYGANLVKVKSEGEKKVINCGIDIFASSFFMLTRWEEYVNKTRDKHNRFPAYASLAYKFNFLDRPVVNEYVEMLWNMLKFLGCKQERKERKFKLVLTHDVDYIKFWKSKTQLIRNSLANILKRRNLQLAIENLAEFYLVNRKKIKDPYNTFEWLMDKSEALRIKSRFYFMADGETEFDKRYNLKEAKNIINYIKKRGHIIGIHPSYNSYNKLDLLQEEVNNLEKVCDSKIKEGRQHYLRFDVPITWQIWNDVGLEIDSTCGYAEEEGFRCGTGDEFSVFNIVTRQKLKLKERPLIFMDDTFITYKKINIKLLSEILNNLIKKVKKYNSSITLLLHNSVFATDKKLNFKSIFEELKKLY